MFVNQIEMVPLKDLVRWERNPRNNQMAVEPIANSIKEYGMVVPLLINKKNEIIAGDTRYQALVLLGEAKAPCVRAEHLTPTQQQAFNVADNKLAEIATWNQDMLKDILLEIQKKYEAKFDPSLMGFQQAEMELMFEGWNSNANRVGDVEAEDTIAPCKISIACKPEEEEEIRVAITEALQEYEVTIK